jgi:hypothetical protein
MVLDQIFGHMDGCDSTMSYLTNSTEALNEMSMDLDDIKFDFDTISDNLGDWIDTPDCKSVLNPNEYTDIICKSEPTLNLSDVSITEAVKYDCMWSSNPSPHTLTQTTLSDNNLLDDFLKMIDSSTSNFELDLDIKEEPCTKPEVSSTPKDPLACERLQEEVKDTSDVRMYTSLDHCYVSRGPSSPSDKLPSNNPLASYPMTPPESSEDEESSSSMSPPPANATNLSYHQRMSSQSLLKKGRSTSRPGEPKFCVKVKLSTDPSRSLLKQQKFHIIKNPNKTSRITGLPTLATTTNASNDLQITSTTKLISNRSQQIQNNIRRRKEESLRLKHDDAREIHNHMERQRRNELKNAYDELKACIPDIAQSDKVSKQMILDTALQNCKLLRTKEAKLKLKRDALKKNNAELLRRISALQNKSSQSTSHQSLSPISLV